MNFNTFFLDKLSGGEQSLAANTKKGSSAAGLFSDIIKVYEPEALRLNPQTGSGAGIEVKQSANLFSESVIECDGSKLQLLSQFIQNFMAGSKEAVNTPGTIHDLQQVVISKKQFILPFGSMEDFLSGLTRELDLNAGADLDIAIDSKSVHAGKLNIFNLDAKKYAAGGIFPAEEKLNPDSTDSSMASAGTAVQSLLNFITNNKNLNLVFKSGSEKISISIHELPEANLETKINFEKLSDDFKKAGISAEADPAGSLLSGTIVGGYNESILSNSGNNTAALIAMPVSAESAGGNIYKTEVIEVSAKPPAEFSKNGQAALAAGSKYYGYTGSGMDIEAIPVLKQFGFQPVENGAEEGVAFLPAAESGISMPETGKGTVNISGLERAGAEKLIEGEMNNSNTKISAELISSAGDAGSANKANGAAGSPLYVQQNSPVFKVIDAESLKPLNADAKQTDGKNPSGNDEELLKNLLEKVDSIPEALFSKRTNHPGSTSATGKLSGGNEVTAATSPVSEFDNRSLDEFVKTATEELNKLSTEETVLKKIIFNDEASRVNEEIKDEKQAGIRKNPTSAGSRIFGAEPEARAAADQLILKNNMNKDNSDTEKDDNSGKADLKVSGGANKEPAKTAQGKTSDEKASSKQKPEDGFKNIMQNSESVTNTGADKFKNIPEMKPLHESMKIIKAPEIVNEFSKIIQAGEKQTMTFQLTPENLGKVKLIVDLVENQINTRIEVENENVKQFIQSNIEQLKQSLQSSGIHLSQLNISLADSEQKSAKPFTRKKAEEKVSKLKEDEKESGAVHKALGYNTYEFLA